MYGHTCLHKQLKTFRYKQQWLSKKKNKGKNIPAILPKKYIPSQILEDTSIQKLDLSLFSWGTLN